MADQANQKAKRFIVKVLSHKTMAVKEYITIVDAEDAHIMRGYFWLVRTGKDAAGVTRAYIARNTGNNTLVFLHHQVIGAGSDEPVYHINGDSLDNRKGNLLRANARVQEL